MGAVGEGCIPALSPRACPLPDGRSDRRSLLGVWAAPPMLLVALRLLSAQQSCASVMGKENISGGRDGREVEE